MKDFGVRIVAGAAVLGNAIEWRGCAKAVFHDGHGAGQKPDKLKWASIGISHDTGETVAINQGVGRKLRANCACTSLFVRPLVDDLMGGVPADDFLCFGLLPVKFHRQGAN